MEKIQKIVAAARKLVEVDNNVEEVQRLDRAQLFIKNTWYPIIQHREDYRVYMAEEIGANPTNAIVDYKVYLGHRRKSTRRRVTSGPQWMRMSRREMKWY